MRFNLLSVKGKGLGLSSGWAGYGTVTTLEVTAQCIYIYAKANRIVQNFPASSTRAAPIRSCVAVATRFYRNCSPLKLILCDFGIFAEKEIIQIK